ncbi:MAG: hypothetical protein JW834_04050 [Candidatus Diapherotrites archaeon]|nr:hypothetical protein [Candidatus Diapherotrites archaeon]
MKPKHYRARLPMIYFSFGNVCVHFLGVVHGAPPRYRLNKGMAQQINKEIKRSDIVLAESYNKESLEYSIGQNLARAKKWVALDSDMAIDRLVEEYGSDRAVEMLKRIKSAAKAKTTELPPKEDVPLLLKALEGDEQALFRLQQVSRSASAIQSAWDELRNLEWTEKILIEAYNALKHRKKMTLLVIGGVGHTPVMDFLENPTYFERRYKNVYGLMNWKAHEVVEMLETAQKPNHAPPKRAARKRVRR